MKPITYEKRQIKVSDLLMAPECSLFEILKCTTNLHYNREAELFKHYEIPVVTEEYIVLSHMEDVYAAESNHLKTMEVVVAIGLEINDILRFAFKCVHFKFYDKRIRIQLIEILTKYLNTNPKGMDWSMQLQEQGCTDINEKLGKIMNCHKETIKLTKRNAELSDQPIPPKNNLPNIHLEKLDISIKNGTMKIDYDGHKASLSKSDWTIKQNINCIIVKIPLDKISLSAQG